MRDQVGKWIPSGVAVGIEANTKPLTEALHDMSVLTTDSLQTDMNLSSTLSGMTVAPVAVGGASGAKASSDVLDRICGALEDLEESNSAMLETSISVLKEILEAVLGIHLTDDDLYDAVNRARSV